MGISSSPFIANLAVVIDLGWGYILSMRSRLFWIPSVGRCNQPSSRWSGMLGTVMTPGNMEGQL